MDSRWWYRLGTRVVWIIGILVWSLLTFTTAAVAFESGSTILFACSAAFTGLGAFVLYRSTRTPGPGWAFTIGLGWLIYTTLILSYWIAKTAPNVFGFFERR